MATVKLPRWWVRLVAKPTVATNVKAAAAGLAAGSAGGAALAWASVGGPLGWWVRAGEALAGAGDNDWRVIPAFVLFVGLPIAAVGWVIWFTGFSRFSDRVKLAAWCAAFGWLSTFYSAEMPGVANAFAKAGIAMALNLALFVGVIGVLLAMGGMGLASLWALDDLGQAVTALTTPPQSDPTDGFFDNHRADAAHLLGQDELKKAGVIDEW